MNAVLAKFSRERVLTNQKPQLLGTLLLAVASLHHKIRNHPRELGGIEITAVHLVQEVGAVHRHVLKQLHHDSAVLGVENDAVLGLGAPPLGQKARSVGVVKCRKIGRHKTANPLVHLHHLFGLSRRFGGFGMRGLASRIPSTRHQNRCQ